MARKTAKRKPQKRATAKKRAPAKTTGTDAFAPRKSKDAFAVADPKVHVYGKAQTCSTNSRGFPMPENRSPFEIVLDASEGFIPLWAPNVTLRWKFNEASMRYFLHPEAAKRELRRLWGEALLAWGDAAPVKFTESDDAWDFEVVMEHNDKCTASGCTLARAFFPDSGRHNLAIYPKMLTQIRKEQIDTFIHEIGHIFGLRHFFANIDERRWPSVIFGTHRPFSIMNYGYNSELTEDDRSDLKLLYSKVWNGELDEINGTRIVIVRPYHDLVHFNWWSAHAAAAYSGA